MSVLPLQPPPGSNAVVSPQIPSVTSNPYKDMGSDEFRQKMQQMEGKDLLTLIRSQSLTPEQQLIAQEVYQKRVQEGSIQTGGQMEGEIK